MELTIYAKKAKTNEGKEFYNYLTRLTNKTTGELESFRVKFTMDCPTIKGSDCPMNIDVQKKNVSVQHEKYTTNDGTEKEANILWVRDFERGSEFVDASADEYF